MHVVREVRRSRKRRSRLLLDPLDPVVEFLVRLERDGVRPIPRDDLDAVETNVGSLDFGDLAKAEGDRRLRRGLRNEKKVAVKSVEILYLQSGCSYRVKLS